MLLKEAHKTEIRVNDDGYIEIFQPDMSTGAVVYLTPQQAEMLESFIGGNMNEALARFAEE